VACGWDTKLWPQHPGKNREKMVDFCGQPKGHYALLKTLVGFMEEMSETGEKLGTCNCDERDREIH
jgi:hypothetical protein